MNLNKLFKTQSELDKRIVEEKRLQGQDLLDKKILALQVELGELANELPEEFKFWSNKKNNYKKALEEYCDCLHFILSIGLDLRFIASRAMTIRIDSNYTKETITGTLNEMFFAVNELNKEIDECSSFTQAETYIALFNLFIGLGEMLGFTWQQIEQSYFEKNKVNHERQGNGY